MDYVHTLGLRPASVEPVRRRHISSVDGDKPPPRLSALLLAPATRHAINTAHPRQLAKLAGKFFDCAVKEGPH